MYKDFNDIFGNFAAGVFNESVRKDYQSKSDDVSYTVEIAVPGLDKSDIKIKNVKGNLEISSEVEDCFWTPGFKKTFTLPDDSDISKISASLSDGILSVNIKKLKESSEKTIEIK